MMAIREEWGELPSYWAVYFAVSDLDASLEQATGLGAKAVAPTLEVGDWGPFTCLEDPQGGYASIIEIVDRG